MKICAICKRESHGFGFIPPPLRASNPNNRKMMKHFCSMNCQEIFSKIYKEKNVIKMSRGKQEECHCFVKVVCSNIALCDRGMWARVKRLRAITSIREPTHNLKVIL